MNEMRDLEQTLAYIQRQIDSRLRDQAELVELGRKGLPAAEYDEESEPLKQRIETLRTRCLRALAHLVDFPPQHIRHRDKLEEFWKGGTYDRSVFIMSKFPAGGAAATPLDAELQHVLDVVAAKVTEAGFCPRIAQVTFQPLLWDNVELHLLGCSRGIAVVEDKYLDELNPNVVMEWGWMRAASKRVLFLQEEGFARKRADLDGLIKETFDWGDPEPGIAAAVARFLAPTN